VVRQQLLSRPSAGTRNSERASMSSSRPSSLRGANSRTLAPAVRNPYKRECQESSISSSTPSYAVGNNRSSRGTRQHTSPITSIGGTDFASDFCLNPYKRSRRLLSFAVEHAASPFPPASAPSTSRHSSPPQVVTQQEQQEEGKQNEDFIDYSIDVAALCRVVDETEAKVAITELNRIYCGKNDSISPSEESIGRSGPEMEQAMMQSTSSSVDMEMELIDHEQPYNSEVSGRHFSLT